MHQTNAVLATRSVKPKKLSPKLSFLAEARLRVVLRRHTPSEPWVDAQFIESIKIDKQGVIVTRRRHDPSVFPPGGSKTAMIRCSECGIFNPPCAMEDGMCLDHAEDRGWGRSPSAYAIQLLELYKLRQYKIKLAPESVAALVRQIKKHEEGCSPTA